MTNLISLIFVHLFIVSLFNSRAQFTFHALMIFLAFLDLSYLVISICFFALPELSSIYFDNFYLLMVPYGLPIGQIFLTGSTYSTLALTTERYVCNQMNINTNSHRQYKCHYAICQFILLCIQTNILKIQFQQVLPQIHSLIQICSIRDNFFTLILIYLLPAVCIENFSIIRKNNSVPGEA